MAQRTLTGVGVSPGRGAAPVVVAPPRVPAPGVGATGTGTPAAAGGLAAHGPTATSDPAPADGGAAIRTAAARVRAELEASAAQTTGEVRAVLEATAMMATDPTLLATAGSLVTDDVGPARAVWEAATRIVDDLRALGGTMAERAWDVIDVRDRIVTALTGGQHPGVPDPGRPYVLVAVDLSPVELALLDPAHVRGIVTGRGGPVSHTAILARAMGIPTVVGVRGAAGLVDGQLVVVDGGAGTVTVDVGPEQLAEMDRSVAARRTFAGAGRTADGRPVPLLANISSADAARHAAAAGAEGVGLLRTEACFMGRRQAPTHEEQVDTYLQVLAAFAGRTVVIRTLDAGSDTALPFVALPEEANPALGVRGIRAFVDHPALLDAQLAAVADAAGRADADVWVMAPMVTTTADADAFVARCAGHGLATVGVTIEVPAAALRADRLLARAAFASIGTNDLTQYTMAADRQNPELAHLCTPWQPAVLELVRLACRAGADLGKPVGICGEAAADPALAAVLVGLGATSLSMAPRALADVGAVLRATPLDTCVRLAEAALAADDDVAARRAVRAGLPALKELGL